MERKLWVGLFLLVSAALAAQEDGARLTVFGAGSLLKGERNFVLFGENFRTEYDNGAKAGLHATFDLNDKWALEGTYAFGGNTWHVTEELGTPTAEQRTFSIHQHRIVGSLLWFLNSTRDRVNFFVIGGGGVVRFSPTDGAKARAAREFVNNPAADIRADNQGTFHLGTGLEAELNSNWGIRIDIQDHIVPIPRYGLPKDNPGGGADFYPVNGIMHDIEPSFGVAFRW